jgi:hypothetical protein
VFVCSACEVFLPLPLSLSSFPFSFFPCSLSECDTSKMGDEESIAEFDMDGVQRDGDDEEADLSGIDFSKLTPLSPEVICRQATINIGTIGHVAHGKSTVVKAISGVKTVRYKNELERNITIKLGYANAKIFKCKVTLS